MQEYKNCSKVFTCRNIELCPIEHVFFVFVTNKIETPAPPPPLHPPTHTHQTTSKEVHYWICKKLS